MTSKSRTLTGFDSTGETEWSRIGRFTGASAISDIELTSAGVEQVRSTAQMLVGPGKVIDPLRLLKIFVSPSKRAVRTLELLLPPLATFPDHTCARSGQVTRISRNLLCEPLSLDRWQPSSALLVERTEDIVEWDYGDYDGLQENEIRELRRQRGLDQEREWDIWSDGCEGGEYVLPCPSQRMLC